MAGHHRAEVAVSAPPGARGKARIFTLGYFTLYNNLMITRALAPFLSRSKKSFLLLGAFFLPTGPWSGLLTLPWAALCAILALAGLFSLALRDDGLGAPQLLIAAGFQFLQVGAAWLFASRWGLGPMGFTEPIVLLTAVHFHFTGFAGSLVAAAASLRIRAPGRAPLLAAAALGMVLGTPLLAVGFVFSPSLKFAASLLLAASFAGLAALTLASLPALARPARALLGVSSASVLAGMALAAAYSVGELRGAATIELSWMPLTHGVLNGLGFCLCGLLGWRAAFKDLREPACPEAPSAQ